MSTATKSSRAVVLHVTQIAYLAAVVAHDAAVESSAEECTRRGYIIVDGQEDGEAFEAACLGIDRVNLEWNVWNLETAKRIAAYEVAEWSIKAGMGMAVDPADRATLTALLAKVRTMSYLNLRKLVVLAMKLKYTGK